MLANLLAIVKLTTGSPVVALGVACLTEAASCRNQGIGKTVRIIIGIVQNTCRVAVFCSQPYALLVVALIYTHNAGCQTGQDAEEQLAVQTQVGTTCINRIVIELVYGIAGEVNSTFATAAPELVTLADTIHITDATIGIVHALVGCMSPYSVGIRGLVIATLTTLVEDAVDGHVGSQPLGNIKRTLVVGCKALVHSVDDAGIVMCEVQSQIVLTLL